MPISSCAASTEKKREYRIRGKTATASVDVYDKDTSHKNFLTIGPALPSPVALVSDQRHKVLKRSLSTLTTLNAGGNYDERSSTDVHVTLQNYPDGTVHVSRTQKAKEKNPDRVCLDRRGLSAIPVVDGEPQLRLLSMQHNLLAKLDGLQEQGFPYLVFLDVYDNQLEKISSLDTLENLRVLLMGKNRIKRIDGLQRIIRLEVLDLHGNQISQITGLNKLSELKVLNLAGNQIRIIGMSDLKGLICLQELNLRRNRLKKLLGFGDTPQLQKLFLSNNEIHNVEDMSSVAKAINLREVAIDNNPVSLGGECVSFLVSYLPQLVLLSNMQITEQVRKAAMAWRRNKESSNAAFMDLTSDVCLNVHREEIISNARTNWELLRSQTKCITAKTSGSFYKDLKMDSDFILTPINKPEIKNQSVLRNKMTEKRISPANSKAFLLPDKKMNFVRSSSQETDNSQNTSSSLTTNLNEVFRLPPILVPIINKLDKIETGLNKEFGGLRRWGSLSSIGPNVDSSSFPSSSSCSPTTSDHEFDKETRTSDVHMRILPEDVEQTINCPVVSAAQADTSSTLSTATSGVTAHSSSTSGSELSNSVSCRSTCSKGSVKRNIKSATNQRSQSSKLPGRAATAKLKPKVVSPPPIVVNKDREQGGDYLIEICGRYLNVYGQGAIRFIDKSWNTTKASDVNFVKFSYINFNNLVGIFSKIKNRFPNVNSLIFCETNIYCFAQLNALSEVQGFVSLKIEPEGNPIYSKQWKPYAIYRLAHWGLKFINDEEVRILYMRYATDIYPMRRLQVTENELKAANEEYQSLSDLVLSSLPDVLLQPLLTRLQVDFNNALTNISAKKWLFSADPALKSVVSKEALQWHRSSVSQEDTVWRQKARVHIGSTLESVCDTVDKLRLLDKEWPHILKEILKDILEDYSQLDVYTKRLLNELK